MPSIPFAFDYPGLHSYKQVEVLNLAGKENVRVSYVISILLGGEWNHLVLTLKHLGKPELARSETALLLMTFHSL